MDTNITPAPAVLPAPSIWMSRHVHCQIMCTIGARPAETGGILLGPVGSDDVTDFYFDTSGLALRPVRRRRAFSSASP